MPLPAPGHTLASSCSVNSAACRCSVSASHTSTPPIPNSNRTDSCCCCCFRLRLFFDSLTRTASTNLCLAVCLALPSPRKQTVRSPTRAAISFAGVFVSFFLYPPKQHRASQERIRSDRIAWEWEWDRIYVLAVAIAMLLLVFIPPLYFSPFSSFEKTIYFQGLHRKKAGDLVDSKGGEI